VLLDDHPLWLDGLEAALSAAGIRVIAKVTCPEAALEIVGAEAPDGLVASLELTGSALDSVSCLRLAKDRTPALRIIALSAHHDGFHLSAAVAAGADAYLSKTASADEIASSVRNCLKGATCDEETPRAREQAAASGPALTTRELEMLHLVARGYTNAQIATKLWVTKWTVKFHLANAYRKLGVSNRTQAARYVFDHGLSELPLERSG
jgi:DNA-binding NarL/FixJ family response regulator